MIMSTSLMSKLITGKVAGVVFRVSLVLLQSFLVICSSLIGLDYA